MKSSIVIVSRALIREWCVFIFWQTASNKSLQALNWKFPVFAMCHSGSYTTNTSWQKWCELSINNTTLWPSFTVKKELNYHTHTNTRAHTHKHARTHTHTHTHTGTELINNQYFKVSLCTVRTDQNRTTNTFPYTLRDSSLILIERYGIKHISSQHSLNPINSVSCVTWMQGPGTCMFGTILNCSVQKIQKVRIAYFLITSETV
jgi:hypothetical protein